MYGVQLRDHRVEREPIRRGFQAGDFQNWVRGLKYNIDKQEDGEKAA